MAVKPPTLLTPTPAFAVLLGPVALAELVAVEPVLPLLAARTQG